MQFSITLTCKKKNNAQFFSPVDLALFRRYRTFERTITIEEISRDVFADPTVADVDGTSRSPSLALGPYDKETV